MIEKLLDRLVGSPTFMDAMRSCVVALAILLAIGLLQGAWLSYMDLRDYLLVRDWWPF